MAVDTVTVGECRDFPYFFVSIFKKQKHCVNLYFSVLNPALIEFDKGTI